MPQTTVSILGLGYVGLSTAICFANSGFKVYGVEVQKEKIEAIRRGKLPFEEKGLPDMLSRALSKGLLIVSEDYSKPILDSTVTFITVGTPSREDGSIDLSYVKRAAEEIGGQLSKNKSRYHLVVEKSTVVPGSTKRVIKQALEERSGLKAFKDFGICVNPEFLRESSAIYDTLHPDALVIGFEDEKSRRVLLSFYRKFYKKMPPIISTSLSNAELIKYSVNTFRATQLSFLNTITNICSRTEGADSEEVISALAKITRIDGRYLKSGLGYGGSCLPKDLRALIAHTRSLNVNCSILEAAQNVNETQPQEAIEMAQRLVGRLDGKKVSVLGLAYKAGTDDTRESVALRLVNSLVEAGAKVSAYDPAAMENARTYLKDGVVFADDARSCIRDSDCCILATDWDEFRKLSPKEFKNLMRFPALIDGRRVYDPGAMKAAGIKYSCLGRMN